MKKENLLIILLLVLGSFFIEVKNIWAGNADIIINEIGAYETDNNEWVEIYNKGAEPIDLTGWKFYEDNTNHNLSVESNKGAQGDFIIEPNEYVIIADVAANFTTNYPEFNGTVIDSSWGTIKESGELIELRTSSDPADVVESFTYIIAPNFSLERANPEINNYTSANWQEHASGNTAGAQNSNFTAEPDTDGDGIPDQEDNCPAKANAEQTDSNKDGIGDACEEPPLDETPPEDITNLAAIAGNATVNLSWTTSMNSANDLSDQILYISDDSGATYNNGISLGTLTTNYQITNLTNNTTYTFKITVKDEVGNESEEGVIIAAMPQEEAPREISPGDIIINEIAWMGTSADSGHLCEWLELYNTTSEEIDLAGWSIYKKEEENDTLLIALAGAIAPTTETSGGYYLIKRVTNTCPDALPSIDADEAGSFGGSGLNNNGEYLMLKNVEENIIDEIDATAGWPAGDNGSKQTMEKTPNNGWQTSAEPEGTPRAANSAGYQDPTEENNEENDEESQSADEQENSSAPTGSGAPTISFNPGELVINELVSDPADGEVEWVELYNNTAASINLAGWTLEDGSEAVTKLSGFISSKNFWVIEKPKGILNNAGDALLLKFNNKIIDRLTYGDWDDDELSDNAPATDDPYSLARRADGQDSDNDFNDFALAEPSKGAANIIKKEQTIAYSTDIIINEFMPNPQGVDNRLEFIELKNIGEKDLDLEGWILGDGSSKRHTLKKENIDSTLLKAGAMLTLYRETTGLALNNSGGDYVKLFTPEEKLAEEIIYDGKAPEGQSYARDKKNHWHWSLLPSPNKDNEFKSRNKAPRAIIEASRQALAGELIQFDASDSYDQEGDKLTYRWNFGNNQNSDEIAPLYFYPQVGEYRVVLEITDEEGATDQAEITITITNGDGVGGDDSLLLPTTNAEQNFSDIIINEFLPNPEGSDVNEWIELKNIGEQEIDLGGWQLDDEEDGSRPYVIPADTLIKPGEYLVFKKAQTRLALNNSADSARLLDPDGYPVLQIDYEKVIEGASYARDDSGGWQWSGRPTPGANNKFSNPQSVKKSRVPSKPVLELSLEEAREQDLGDRLRVRGAVSAPPGLLGKQIFYLAGSGMQIYMYKKDFPDLKVGDYVEVTGELSQSGGESRIKVKEKSDIKILERGEAPIPHSLSVGEINENTEGYLTTIKGEVIETRGSSVFVDDGSDEVKVYIKSSTDINTELKERDLVKITGIVSQTRSGYRLLPRFPEDIEIVGNNNTTNEESAQTAVLKKTAQEQTAVKYLSATTMALVLALGGLMMRMRKEVRK